MQYLKIGEVAQRSGLGVETIRYYERRGLLAEPERRPSGYRQYEESILDRLKFICRSKELGFTLSEINDLLKLWFDTSTKCCDVRKLALEKIADIESKVASLNKMKRSLKHLMDNCQQRDTIHGCPLFVGLGTQEPP